MIKLNYINDIYSSNFYDWTKNFYFNCETVNYLTIRDFDGSCDKIQKDYLFMDSDIGYFKIVPINFQRVDCFHYFMDLL